MFNIIKTLEIICLLQQLILWLFSETLMSGQTCRFSFSAGHPDEVLRVIDGLSNSTSFGVDEIDTYVVKLIKLDFLPAITHIVNLSLSSN